MNVGLMVVTDTTAPPSWESDGYGQNLTVTPAWKR
jgi:hypothetical protein